MSRYLELLRKITPGSTNYEINEKTQPSIPSVLVGARAAGDISFNSYFVGVLSVLEGRCPDHIDAADWQQAVADGRRFLARWDEQAHALGWTARDLFGLHQVPDQPCPTYRRLSRYDETGLIWLLRGRPVVALTTDTAAIQSGTGAITVYRRYRKPAFGPLGDSLDDLEA